MADKKSGRRSANGATHPRKRERGDRNVATEHDDATPSISLSNSAHAATRRAWFPVLAPIGVGLVATALKNSRLRAGLPSTERHDYLIPEDRSNAGPGTALVRRRSIAMLVAAEAAGLSSAMGKKNEPDKQAFGLGLMAPGGGFVYTKDPHLAVGNIALMGLALLTWVLTGNLAAVPAVWLGGAAYAGRRARAGGNWPAAKAVVPATAGLSAYLFLRRRSGKLKDSREEAKRRNEYLRVADRPFLSQHNGSPSVGPELNDRELAMARHLLNRSLSPVGDWSKFETPNDPFQTSALRYQCSLPSWSLSLLNFTRMPAFSGYLAEAQRRNIQRHALKKVWSYWLAENLWGRFRANPDPIVDENIMYSGYLSQAIGLYETVSGDHSFSEPDSLVLEWTKSKRFTYDFKKINAAQVDNITRSPYGLFSCEPNFVYDYCNYIGATGIVICDRIHGTTFWETAGPLFLRGAHEEFTTLAGDNVFIKSARLGYTISGGNAITCGASAGLIRPFSPELADRWWTIFQNEGRAISDGVFAVPFGDGMGVVDPGNYRAHGPLAALGNLLFCATEHGDHELVEAIMARFEQEYDGQIAVDEDGALVIGNHSYAWGHAPFALGMFNRRAGWNDIVNNGMPKPWEEGPRLQKADYPNVLVTRAETDGHALDIVVRPGNGIRRADLGLDRLIPGRQYSIRGATTDVVTAGLDGKATITVELGIRNQIEVAPAS